MAEMVFGQSFGIEVPAGRYTARFAGTESRPDMVGTMGENAGKSQPRMAWVFEIVDGPHRSARICQETGTAAVQRSGALKMLTGLNGGPMAIGQRVNTDIYVNKLYSLKIAANPDSPKGNLHVADLEPMGGGAPTIHPSGAHNPSPAPTRPASSPPPPPRRQAAPAAPPPPPEPQFWLEEEGSAADPLLLTLAQIREKAKNGTEGLFWCPENGKEYHPVDASFLAGGDPFPG